MLKESRRVEGEGKGRGDEEGCCEGFSGVEGEGKGWRVKGAV